MRRFLNIDISKDIADNKQISEFLNSHNAKPIANHWYSMDCDDNVNDYIQSIYSATSSDDFVLLIEEPKAGDFVVRQIRGSLVVM